MNKKEAPDKHTETHSCDCDRKETHRDVIYRADAIDACIRVREYHAYDEIEEIKALPSAEPEPLSDAYIKAVWTWLLDYQIKVAKLKGRYTPYEVLSWVANDWRKEHE